MTDRTEPLLSVRELRVSFPGKGRRAARTEVLKGVDLDIRPASSSATNPSRPSTRPPGPPSSTSCFNAAGWDGSLPRPGPRPGELSRQLSDHGCERLVK